MDVKIDYAPEPTSKPPANTVPPTILFNAKFVKP